MALDLGAESDRFAKDLGSLLNSTVCNGPRLKTIAFPTYTVVGYKIDKHNFRGEGIPLTIDKAPPKFYLSLSFKLQPNAEKDHLQVMSSVVLLATQPQVRDNNLLLHYDYERNKPDGYPEAHLQVCASSPVWEEAGRRLNGDLRLLDRLHLPVGGRRFRPTIEDIIEFLIVEQLVKARPNWSVALEARREEFRERQLRAAIRRHPDVALDQLRQDGHLA